MTPRSAAATARKRSLVKHATLADSERGRQASSARSRREARDVEGAADADDAEDRVAKRRRGGFQVGPRNLPAGAYLGKAKRIKAELIDKAKVKRAYFKALQRDGVSVPPPPRSSSRRAGKKEGGGMEATDDGTESDGQHDEAEALADDGISSQSTRTSAPTPKSSDKYEGKFAEEQRQQEEARRQLEELRSRPAPSRLGTTARRKPSTSFANPTAADRRTKQRVEPSVDGGKERARTREEAETARRQRRAAYQQTSRSRAGASRGQPNLNARVAVMLEKIQQQVQQQRDGGSSVLDGGGGGGGGGARGRGESRRG